MTYDSGLLLAFITGVTGAWHCLGMCSGLAGGFLIAVAPATRVRSAIVYHGARIAVYVTLGSLGALLSRVLVQTGIVGKGQGLSMLLAGGLVILIGVTLLRRPPTCNDCRRGGGPDRLHGARHPLLGGVLNGLVPCSLVFSVALPAATHGDVLYAASMMLAFGLGTLPAMFGISLLSARIGAHLHGYGTRVAGIAVVGLGVWTAYEGWIFFDVMRGLANW